MSADGQLGRRRLLAQQPKGDARRVGRREQFDQVLRPVEQHAIRCDEAVLGKDATEVRWPIGFDAIHHDGARQLFVVVMALLIVVLALLDE